MAKYKKLEDGMGFDVNTEEETLKIACCDCGLVHYIGITIKDDKNIMIGFKRDRRATAQLRRHSYGFLHRPLSGDKWQVDRHKAGK